MYLIYVIIFLIEGDCAGSNLFGAVLSGTLVEFEKNDDRIENKRLIVREASLSHSQFTGTSSSIEAARLCDEHGPICKIEKARQ